MIKDKELKLELLKKLMKDMDGRVVENDLKPKTEMVVKAEGSSPEETKQKIIDKLSNLPLPDEKEVAGDPDKAMESMGSGGMEECAPEERDDQSYLDEMPSSMKEKLLKAMKAAKNN